MSHAIRIHEYGGPDVLKWEEVTVAAPGPGQVRIKQSAVGLNFIDIYQRTGLYAQPSFPFIPGSEGAGVVTAIGEGVRDLKVGRRVAYAGVIGAYAEERLIAADRVVKIADEVDDQTAAAIMLKGMTAQYLLRRTYKVGPETTLLFHAAAGGVGLIACQWASGTRRDGDRHRRLVRQGADRAGPWLPPCHQHARGRPRRQGDGLHRRQGVDVVYDSIGKDTFPASLDCLKPLGLWVSFGTVVGAGAAVQHRASVAEGLALRHAPWASDLYRFAQGSGGYGKRLVRRGEQGKGQDRRQSDLSVGRGCRGTA